MDLGKQHDIKEFAFPISSLFPHCHIQNLQCLFNVVSIIEETRRGRATNEGMILSLSVTSSQG